MKKFISILVFSILIFTGISMQADSTYVVNGAEVVTNENGVVQPTNYTAETATETDYNLQGDVKYSFWKAIKSFIYFINWLFVVVFILLAWLINDTAEAKNKATWFSWFDKIPKTLRSLAIGLLLAALFYWGFGYSSRTEVMSLIFSVIVTMVIYKIGVDKVLRWISKRFFGINAFEDTKQ